MAGVFLFVQILLDIDQWSQAKQPSKEMWYLVLLPGVESFNAPIMTGAKVCLRCCMLKVKTWKKLYYKNWRNNYLVLIWKPAGQLFSVCISLNRNKTMNSKNLEFNWKKIEEYYTRYLILKDLDLGGKYNISVLLTVGFLENNKRLASDYCYSAISGGIRNKSFSSCKFDY